MDLELLRARATCTICRSKLPPRTQVYWDAAEKTATCLSCARMASAEVPAPVEHTVGGSDDAAVPESPAAAVAGGPASDAASDTAAGGTDPGRPVPDERREATVDSSFDWMDWPAARPASRPAEGPSTHVAEGAPAPASAQPDAGPGPAVEPRPTVVAKGSGPELPPAPARRPAAAGDEGPTLDLTVVGRARPSHHDDIRAPLPDGVIDRGDMGEGRVGQTLEAARIHGLEVLHGLVADPAVPAIDHLVIAVNGVWVIRAQASLQGQLERRDMGDWFTADPRLYVKDEDATYLVDEARRQVDAVRGRLAPTAFGDLPVRGVVCFGTAPAGWVNTPFDIANVSVTWRNHLVEPMLAPVLIDTASRHRLTALLAAARDQARTA